MSNDVKFFETLVLSAGNLTECFVNRGSPKYAITVMVRQEYDLGRLILDAFLFSNNLDSRKDCIG